MKGIIKTADYVIFGVSFKNKNGEYGMNNAVFKDNESEWKFRHLSNSDRHDLYREWLWQKGEVRFTYNDTKHTDEVEFEGTIEELCLVIKNNKSQIKVFVPHGTITEEEEKMIPRKSFVPFLRIV